MAEAEVNVEAGELLARAREMWLRQQASKVVNPELGDVLARLYRVVGRQQWLIDIDVITAKE